jgi:predicted NAD-dependent protein-ADP-ribosyltransferase YbiA (DUF1768 family)
VTKPKRQKKYVDRKAIIKDIDAALRKHQRILNAASGEELTAMLLRESNNEEYKRHDEAKEKLLAKADRMKNTRLRKLQNLLAAFDTTPIGLAGYEKPQATLEKL